MIAKNNGGKHSLSLDLSYSLASLSSPCLLSSGEKDSRAYNQGQNTGDISKRQVAGFRSCEMIQSGPSHQFNEFCTRIDILCRNREPWIRKLPWLTFTENLWIQRRAIFLLLPPTAGSYCHFHFIGTSITSFACQCVLTLIPSIRKTLADSVEMTIHTPCIRK
jgi:hypothetical protein